MAAIALDYDRYLFALWLDPLMAILAKFEPSAPRPEPPPTAGDEPWAAKRSAVNASHGPLMTLGNVASVHVRLIACARIAGGFRRSGSAT